MGRKKINKKIEPIASTSSRNLTYSKRKKGLLKKAMELSILCGQKMFMVIFDEL